MYGLFVVSGHQHDIKTGAARLDVCTLAAGVVPSCPVHEASSAYRSAKACCVLLLVIFKFAEDASRGSSGLGHREELGSDWEVRAHTISTRVGLLTHAALVTI